MIRSKAPIARRSTLGFRRFTAQLLDQELWCLGRDVARKSNILLDLGFCRYRSADAKSEATLYTTAIPDGGTIWLWAFGVAITEPGHGSTFVRRYDFAPRSTPRESFLGIHDAESVGHLRQPTGHREWATLRRQLTKLCQWLAYYEHWIAENQSHGWRQECLAKRGKPTIVDARSMAPAWEVAAKTCKHLNASTLIDRIGPWAGVLHSLRQQCSLSTKPCPIVRPSTKVTAS